MAFEKSWSRSRNPAAAEVTRPNCRENVRLLTSAATVFLKPLQSIKEERVVHVFESSMVKVSREGREGREEITANQEVSLRHLRGYCATH
jgi:hypothetical protein